MKRADYTAALVAQRQWDSAFVLLHNAPAGVGAVDASRHIPILYAHNELLRTYTRRETARALESAAAIVCVSSFLAEQTAVRLPPGLRDRVAVVRNGVDTTFFRPSARPAEDGASPLEVLFVGRVIPDKGAHILAEAALRVPGIRITIVGSEGFSATAPPTPYESRLRQSIAALGERGRWLPFKPREVIADLMRSSDVVVVPSVWPDPFALTTLEGMASGAAVVASRIGGIPEAVSDAGLLVPPGDVDALASTLADLDHDRGELATWKTTGRTYAEANDWGVAWSCLARTLGVVPA
jgi:glycosyltransferase involved in cell wall biosynthesis